MAAKKKDPPVIQPLNTYGMKAGAGLTQLNYDRYAFAHRFSIDRGCPMRQDLFRNISEKLLPGHFEWHSWTDKMIYGMCNHSLLGVPGCSNSGKTFSIVSFACVWWMISPENSSVMLVSTSKGSLRRRGWAEVSRCYANTKPRKVGNFVDSRMMWQFTKGDDKHAIVGKAVEEGSTQKVADDIKGVHTERQMVIIDEATAVPAAIYEACANLYSYPKEFILVLIGNPLNRLDQFGRFCEPRDGWASVGEDTDEWEGRSQGSLGGRRPYVIRFDAEKSPNIIEEKMVSKHLPTKTGVDAAKRNAGGGATPLYWQNFRGFWPPEGLTKTVFSETQFNKNKVYERHKFSGRNFHIIGAFDHARDGGDRPVLRFAKCGEILGGSVLDMGIEMLPPITVPVDATSTNPIGYQLAEQIKRQCEGFEYEGQKLTCPPENFAMDATGGGADFADILQRLWSPNFARVQFGGSPSEGSTSLEDSRPAKEVYLNKRAEMYFWMSNVVSAGQLKGLDQDTAQELMNMIFDDMKPDGSCRKLIKLMSKVEYRKLYHKSPDYADAMVMLGEPAKRLGFQLAAIGQTVHINEDWDKTVDTCNAVHDEVGLYQIEETYEEEAA